MGPHIRPYDHARHFAAVSRFLVEIHRPGSVFAAWLQPRWEYMHHHALIRGMPLEKIGLVEQGGELVGVVHFEHDPAFVYFQVRPGFERAKASMVDYAELHFGGPVRGRHTLGLYINEFDETLTAIAAGRGFRLETAGEEVHARYVPGDSVPRAPLPGGFHLQSLEDGNDLRAVHGVLWRGFDHPGPPPEAGVADRKRMQEAPGFRKDLTVVAVAPDGGYAAYAGMWHVPENRIGYLEPVATDPDYRRLGLGRAVVLEAVRRVVALGAEVVWVGSGQAFYEAVGFTRMFTTKLWTKQLGA